MRDPRNFGQGLGHGHVQIIVMLKPHNGDDIGLAGHAIYLGDVGQVGDLLGHRANFAGLGIYQYEGGKHSEIIEDGHQGLPWYSGCRQEAGYGFIMHGSTMTLLSILRSEFSGYDGRSLKRDILAGVTVATVALPLSLAFGLASGATAAAGLITAIFAGLIMGTLSGAPSQVSGPTGAMSAVLIVVASQYHLPGVWIASLMAGMMVLIMAVFRLGRAVLWVPSPVVGGFTSGIALIIFVGQISNALGVAPSGAATAFGKLIEYVARLQTGQLDVNWHSMATTGLVIFGMIILSSMPMLRSVPAAVVAVAIATGLSVLMGFSLPTIGTIPGGLILPDHYVPAWSDLLLARELVFPAMSLAILCVLQALVCGVACTAITGKPMEMDQELIAQGLGNLILPFLGGIPASGEIARSKVGVATGGQTRLTTIFHAISLILVVLFLRDWIARIPLAALAGVLIVTSVRMNDWKEAKWLVGHGFKTPIGIFGITLTATAALDLTTAIIVGLLVSMVMFVSRIGATAVSIKPVDADIMRGRGYAMNEPNPDVAVAYITGPIFFGNVQIIKERFVKLPGHTLILSMRGVPSIDLSGARLIGQMAENMMARRGALMLAAVQPSVRTMLDRAGISESIGETNFFWSADQAIFAAHGSVNPR